MKKQQFSIPTTPPWKANLFSNILTSLLLVYVFLWNLSTLGISRPSFIQPPRMISSLLGVDQIWDMFAPTPLREDGWYVIPGQLRDGKEINIFTGGAVNWEKPPLLSAIYPNDRWRSYFSKTTP